MDVELRQLRYFLAVAEELNFTRAAARLHMDQPALSRQVRKLEQVLGVQLLTRTSRQVALTPAGQELLEGTRRLLAAAEQTLDAVRRVGLAERRVLRLGWLVPFKDQLMARLVRSFEADTGATVRLRHADFSDPSAGLADGSVDAAIVNPPLGTPGLAYEVLLREPRVAMLPSSHPLAQERSIAIAQLAALDLDWAVPPDDDSVWQAHWAAAETRGGALPERAVRFADNEGYLQAVAAGHAFGLSLAAAAEPAMTFGVVAVPVHDITPTTIALGWRADDPHPLLPALVDAARRLATPVV